MLIGWYIQRGNRSVPIYRVKAWRQPNEDGGKRPTFMLYKARVRYNNWENYTDLGYGFMKLSTDSA